jgi:hypothetical protein
VRLLTINREKVVQIIIVIFSLGLIVSGLYFIKTGSAQATDNLPHNTVSHINSYYFYQQGIQTVFYIKTESIGAFMAGNPINVSITTNGLDVSSIQLEFLGASQYFPNHTQPIMPTLPPYPNENDWQIYENAMTAYSNQIDQQYKNLGDNIIFLTNDTDVETSFFNTTLANYSTFSGSISNLTYSVGGKYSIGITVMPREGGVFGYGVGDTNYVLNDYIEVAPSETVLQIQNNNIMVGLSYVGIGLAPFLAGLLLFIEFLKPFTHKRAEDDLE